MNKVLSNKGKSGRYLVRILALILAALVLLGTAPTGILYAYASETEVSSWADLKDAVENGTASTIKVSGTLYADKEISVSRDVTITGDAIIYRSPVAETQDFSNFVVNNGKTLTLEGITLSGERGLKALQLDPDSSGNNSGKYLSFTTEYEDHAGSWLTLDSTVIWDLTEDGEGYIVSRDGFHMNIMHHDGQDASRYGVGVRMYSEKAKYNEGLKGYNEDDRYLIDDDGYLYSTEYGYMYFSGDVSASGGKDKDNSGSNPKIKIVEAPYTSSELPEKNGYRGFFVQVNSGSTLNIAGAELKDFVTDGTVKDAAPIVVDGGVLNLNGGTISDNSVGYNANNKESARPANHQNGKSVVDYLKELDTNNTAGAIIFTNGAKGNLSGTISNNRGDAGAIYVDKKAEVSITSGSISSNIGIHKAGAAHITDGGSVTMTGGEISKNYTWHKGGAVCATSYKCDDPTAAFILKGGTLSENFAMLRGGAIEVESNEVQLLSGTITDNYCRALGGGIYVEGDNADHMYSLYIASSCITGNKAVAEKAETPADKTLENQTLDRILNTSTGYGFVNELTENIATGWTGDIKDFTRWGDYQGYGGGLWLCAIGGNATFGANDDVDDDGNEFVYSTVIKLNKAETNRGQDINLRPTRPDKGSAINVLGLQNVTTWKIEGSNPAQYIQDGKTYTGPLKIVNEDTTQGCDGALQITNNLARIGGGIAANGTVVFGKASNTIRLNTSIEIQKTWSDKIDKNDRKEIELQLSLKDGDEITPLEGYTITLDGEVDTDVSDNNPAWEKDEWLGYFSLPLTTTKENGEVVPLFWIRKPGADEWLDPSKAKDQKEIYELVDSGMKAEDFEVKYGFVVTETSEDESYVLNPGEMALSYIHADEGKEQDYFDLSGRKIATVRVDLMTMTFGNKVTNEPLETEKYIEKNVHKEIAVDDTFNYEIISYVPEGADKVTVTDELGEYLKFSNGGNVKVYDLGEENNHKTKEKALEDNDTATVDTADTDGKNITDDVTAISTDNNTLNVVIANEYEIVDDKINYSKNLIKDLDLYGHYILVKFDAELSQTAKDKIDAIASGEIKDVVTENDPLKVTEEQIEHEGLKNKAKYTVEVANGGKYKTDTNEVTVKPEKPEIEKYINQNVHEDIELDDEFIYDIIAYVTKDADKVVITDILDDQLAFVSAKEDVKVYDLDTKNNHKTLDKAEADGETATVTTGTLIEGNFANIDKQILTVTLDDDVTVDDEGGVINRKNDLVKNLRGHYIRVEFTAKLTDKAKEDISKLAAAKITDNDPLDVTDEQAIHRGIPNQASYEIEVGNVSKYADDSNIVTVKPNEDEFTIKISKTDLGGTELSGAEIKVTGPAGYSETWTTKVEEGEDAVKPHELTLSAGEYTLVEVVAPAGYQQVTTEIKFVVNEDGTITLKTATEELDGDGQVDLLAEDHLILRDAPTKEKEPDAAYVDIHAKKVQEGKNLEGADYQFELVDEDGNVVASARNDKDGNITFSNVGPFNEEGTYSFTIREVKGNKANVDYDETVYNVTVKVSAEEAAVEDSADDASSENSGSDAIIKDAEETVDTNEAAAPQSDAAADESLDQEATDDNETVDNTDENENQDATGENSQEDSAEEQPAEENNESAETQEEAGSIKLEATVEYPAEVKFTNKYNDVPVKISKTDLGGVELSGASMKLVGPEGFTDEWTSASTPHELELTPGEYTMTEVVAPQGYKQVTTEILFVVAEDNTVELLTTTVDNGGEVTVEEGNTVILKDAPDKEPDFPNTPGDYPVEFSKTDLDGKEVPGATIKVEGPDGFSEQWTSTTASHTLNLKPGRYTMTEVVAPQGFKTITTEMVFEVTEDGEVNLITTTVDNGGKIEVMNGNHVILRDAPDKDPNFPSTGGDNPPGSTTPPSGNPPAGSTPKTGDDNMAGIWITLAILALGTLITALRIRKEN